jgi:hypothetical protein
VGWWGPFAWLDASGEVVFEGELPASMKFSYSSPLALRRHGKSALWALESYLPPDPEGHTSEEITNITILEVGDGKSSVVETVKFADIRVPIRVESGWKVKNTLDSPAWLSGDRDVLVYRHHWEIDPPGGEWLNVLEIWAKEPGKKARMLDICALYAGAAGTFFYETDASGKLQEKYDEERMMWNDDLTPFPASTGSKVAYARRNKIMALEVAR